MRILIISMLIFATPLMADTESEITAALDYFAEAWNEGELETIRGYYHADFVLVSSDGVIGLQQRMNDLESIAKAGEDRGTLNYSEVEVKALGDGHAMAYSRMSLKFSDGSGFNNRQTTVYTRTPFGWKAILTHN